MTPHLYIGCDPDLRTLNAAIITADKVPLAVFLRRNKSHLTGDKAVAAAMPVVSKLADDIVAFFVANEVYQMCPMTLIVESQSIQHALKERKSGKHKVDPDDILHTGQIAGILMGVLGELVGGNVVLVAPATWKKGQPKQIHHPRIYQRLLWPQSFCKKDNGAIFPAEMEYAKLTKYSGEKVNPGDFADINDSLGLALYGAENNL